MWRGFVRSESPRAADHRTMCDKYHQEMPLGWPEWRRQQQRDAKG